MRILDDYKIDGNGVSISQHNNDMLQIKKQIVDIYNLDDNFVKSLEKCIKYNNVGKVIDLYLDNNW